MYAIVETGGKQYRVQPGDTIAVEHLAGEPGDTLDLDRVLLIGGEGERARVGAPGVAGAVVRAEVVEHARGQKVIVFRYKSKVRYRRKTGHRQSLTRLRITDILVDGESQAKSASSGAPAESVAVAEPAKSEVAETPAPAARRRRAAPAAATETPGEEEMPAAAAEAGPAPEEVKE